MTPQRKKQTRKIQICCDCKKSYSERSGLNRHQNIPEITGIFYQCLTCGEKNCTIGQMKSHQNMHLVEEIVVTEFKEMSYRLNSDRFVAHNYLLYNGDEHKCSECEEIFKDTADLLVHVSEGHGRYKYLNAEPSSKKMKVVNSAPGIRNEVLEAHSEPGKLKIDDIDENTNDFQELLAEHSTRVETQTEAIDYKKKYEELQREHTILRSEYERILRCLKTYTDANLSSNTVVKTIESCPVQ